MNFGISIATEADSDDLKKKVIDNLPDNVTRLPLSSSLKPVHVTRFRVPNTHIYIFSCDATLPRGADIPGAPLLVFHQALFDLIDTGAVKVLYGDSVAYTMKAFDNNDEKRMYFSAVQMLPHDFNRLVPYHTFLSKSWRPRRSVSVMQGDESLFLPMWWEEAWKFPATQRHALQERPAHG